MKLSFEWLQDFVDLSGISPAELAEKLTMGAFEVEEITDFGPAIEGDVVVGQIVAIEPHPNADKIRLTKILLEEGQEPREIVCGAWNIEVGHKIPVALPGSLVINRHDGTQLAIKRSKIRGVESNGMLCSAPELGVAGSSEGILLLPENTPVGTNAKELLHLVRDHILHVGTRSNRGDALCVLGMAREVAVLCKRPLLSVAGINSNGHPGALAETDTATTPVNVAIENPSDCPFFTGRVLTGFKIEPAPYRISRRLEAVGIRPVNNIVDITNYVLQEVGQPLHAYDLAKVSGNQLTARRARNGEKLVTIDARERSLTEECLIIADGTDVVGVAGVMGGKGSEISDDTTSLVLEAASFNSAVVRRSSRLLGLSSDSSLRFERGVDTAGVRSASDRASYLIVQHCNAKLGKMSTAGDDSVPEKIVQLRMSELKRITEIIMTSDETAELLQPLGFQGIVTPDMYNAGILKVQIPSFRQKDVTREIDLIEEVCRLWGYNRIKPSLPQSTQPAQAVDNLSSKVKACLSAQGLNEAWTSSLIALHDLNAHGVLSTDGGNAVKVLNPLSPEHQALRTSLLPGLLKSLAYNQDHGRRSPWLFEVGRIYERKAASVAEKVVDAVTTALHAGLDARSTGTKEETRVAAVIVNEPLRGLWRQAAYTDQNGDQGFYTTKGILENLVDVLAVDTLSIRYTATSEQGWYHPGRCAEITNKDGEVLGYIGEVHPVVAGGYGIKSRTCAFEVSLDLLRKLSREPGLREFYLTPTIERDLTIDLNKKTSASQVESCIRSADTSMLRQLELVSIFDLSEEQKSLSYRLSFQHPSETLTTAAVDSALSDIRAKLKSDLDCSFRA